MKVTNFTITEKNGGVLVTGEGIEPFALHEGETLVMTYPSGVSITLTCVGVFNEQLPETDILDETILEENL